MIVSWRRRSLAFATASVRVRAPSFRNSEFDVEFHGVQRDVEAACNGLVGQAFRQRRQHFEFARRQQGVTEALAHRAEAGFLFPRAGQADHQAGGDRPDRRVDLARVGIA